MIVDDPLLYPNRKSFVFSIKAQFPNLKLNVNKYGLDALTTEALQLYKSSPKQFAAVCGDQFIMEESLGASLYISTKLEFQTRTEKDTFNIDSNCYFDKTMIEVILLLKLAANWFSQSLYSQRVSLTIAVLQKGGNMKILQSKIPELKINDQGVLYLDCIKSGGGDDIDKKLQWCKDIMTRLLDYASSDFPDSLKNYTLSETIDTYKMDYKKIGLDVVYGFASKNVIEIRKHLKEEYQDLTSKQLFLSKLLQDVSNKYINIGSVAVGWDYKSIQLEVLNELKVLNQTLTDSIKSIIAYDDVCYDHVEACKDFNNVVDLSLIDAFTSCYVIKSKCDGIIYGPRYLLSVGKDLYKEDSGILEKGINKTIVANYKISQTEDDITVILNGRADCTQVIHRDKDYDLVHAYYGAFYSPCSDIICPDVVMGAVEASFIFTDTPI